MASFNSSSNTGSVGLFDLKGGVAKQVIGGGNNLCICFGLQHVRAEALGTDVYLFVGESGQFMERDTTFGENTAVGLKELEEVKGGCFLNEMSLLQKN